MPEFRTLLDGYRRFRTLSYPQQRARWDNLAHTGQSPKIMIIACSDSRVDPTTIFDTGPGEVFVVRNVANLVPPYETSAGRHGVSAALEFAVNHLQVAHILVLGHAQCGGIRVALNPESLPEGSFISSWMSMVKEPREQVLAAYALSPDCNPQQALELAAIRQSIAHLRSFPFVAEREAAGSLVLHGGYFGIADGVLQLLDTETGHFKPVGIFPASN